MEGHIGKDKIEQKLKNIAQATKNNINNIKQIRNANNDNIDPRENNDHMQSLIRLASQQLLIEMLRLRRTLGPRDNFIQIAQNMTLSELDEYKKVISALAEADDIDQPLMTEDDVIMRKYLTQPLHSNICRSKTAFSPCLAQVIDQHHEANEELSSGLIFFIISALAYISIGIFGVEERIDETTLYIIRTALPIMIGLGTHQSISGIRGVIQTFPIVNKETRRFIREGVFAED
jgi:hypothetical protein